MRRSTLTIALYLLAVFASGTVVGAFGYRLVSVAPVSAKARSTPEEWRKQYLNEMQTRVNLTPAQLQQLNSILDQTRSRFHEAREKHDGLMKQIKLEQTNRVRAILSDTQRSEYEKLHAEREERAKLAANAK